jgi:N-acetylmuramoyl-L-alanine amidase
MRKKVLLALLLVFITAYLFPLTISLRSYDHQDYTRIVFEGDEPFHYNVSSSGSPDNFLEVALDKKAKVDQNITVMDRSKVLDRVVHRWEEGNSVFKVHMQSGFKVKRQFVLERPYRLVFDIVKGPSRASVAPKSSHPASDQSASKENVSTPQEEQKEEKTPPEAQEQQQEEPQEQESPQVTDEEEQREGSFNHKRTVIDTICIDPGHGGTDLGAVGKTKLAEKDITLNVSKKLKRYIESRLGLTVVMTRETDEEVSLNSRVSRANNRKAQLFVSIHVNSSYRKSARGPETFYVSLKATDQDAFSLSQKENNSFQEIEKLAEEDDDLKMILWNMAQTEYIKESSKLADFIQYELNILMHTRNRGVKQAPFRVLMRAAMPAVLVEIAFVSNATEEKKLSQETFLEEVAQAIYTGISKYIYYHNNLVR